MINVLLSSYDFHENWAYETMKPLLYHNMKVTVIPFSFEDEKVHSQEDYDKEYGPDGVHTPYIYRPFHFYGISDITFIDYYRDSHDLAKKKIKEADILFLTGGLPDQYLRRLQEFDLVSLIQKFDGIIIGASAGAMIQLDHYHVTPDNDYPFYHYQTGLGLVKGFEIECHYAHSSIQDEGLQRVILEKHLPTYTIANNGGLLIQDNQRMTFGNAQCVHQ